MFAWHTQDVYREKQEQRREAARVRTMDPYIVGTVGFSEGRMIDKSEAEYATGGEVERTSLHLDLLIILSTRSS